MVSYRSDGRAGAAVVSQVVLLADEDQCLQGVEDGGVPFLLDILDVHACRYCLWCFYVRDVLAR